MANDRGNTALHYACFFRFDDMVEMLVQAGAQPFLMNMNSAVPADQTSDEIREFLLGRFIIIIYAPHFHQITNLNAFQTISPGTRKQNNPYHTERTTKQP